MLISRITATLDDDDAADAPLFIDLLDDARDDRFICEHCDQIISDERRLFIGDISGNGCSYHISCLPQPDRDRITDAAKNY